METVLKTLVRIWIFILFMLMPWGIEMPVFAQNSNATIEQNNDDEINSDEDIDNEEYDTDDEDNNNEDENDDEFEDEEYDDDQDNDEYFDEEEPAEAMAGTPEPKSEKPVAEEPAAQEPTPESAPPESKAPVPPATKTKAPSVSKQKVAPSEREEYPTDTVIFNFRNAKLQSLIDWTAKVHNVSFIPDDAVKGGAKQPDINIAQHTISFNTKTPLTKKQAWGLFITFLDLAGMAVVPGPEKGFFRIIPSKNAATAALPTFINVSYEDLPANDARIRYVYFLQNTTPDQIDEWIKSLKLASYQVFKDLKALIFTDRSSKIRSIMQIVKELDKASQPEALKVIKLQRADVREVVELYNKLAQKEEPARSFGLTPKKEPTLFYFPKDVNLFEDQRTNSLIVLGPKNAIERVEDFVQKFVDRELEEPRSPLHRITLHYTDATQMADILTKVTAFAPDSDASKYGGVRDGEKYFKKMVFAPETSSNTLLVNAAPEDYPHIERIVRKLDIKQQQVATEVLIVSVSATKSKQLGVHLRNKDNDVLGKVNFQTSGMQVGPGKSTSILVDKDKGLMANLIELAKGNIPGTTLFSFGPGNNIWGLLKFLEQHVRAQVISNPFLIATNRYEAKVSTGEIRRVDTSTIFGANTSGTTKGDKEALLEVKLTPRISDVDYGIINLKIEVDITEFTEPDNENSAERVQKRIETNANVANREVLVLGGLMRDKESENERSTPLLGRIPLVGWAFKSKTKTREKESLLIFISPRIIETSEHEVGAYTARKAHEAQEFSDKMGSYIESEKRDPIYRWFFKDDTESSPQQFMRDFLEDKEIHAPHAPSTTKEVSEKKEPTQNKSTEPKKKRSLVTFMDDTSTDLKGKS